MTQLCGGNKWMTAWMECQMETRATERKRRATKQSSRPARAKRARLERRAATRAADLRKTPKGTHVTTNATSAAGLCSFALALQPFRQENKSKDRRKNARLCCVGREESRHIRGCANIGARNTEGDGDGAAATGRSSRDKDAHCATNSGRPASTMGERRGESQGSTPVQHVSPRVRIETQCCTLSHRCMSTCS